MDNSNYRLDRIAFQALSFEDADKEMRNSAGLTYEEGISHFNYLIRVAYRFLNEESPRMDKTVFEKIKRV